jgi:uncharacterized membrane protein YdjX (TVP38/TMEM64 family)
MKRIPSSRIVLALILLCAVVASSVMLAVPDYRNRFNAHLTAFLETVQRLEAWGPVVVGAAFIPACLLFLPGSPLTLFGGFAFGGTLAGLARTTAAVSIGSTLGASLAFLTGRYLARRWIEQKVAGYPRFGAIDSAVGRQGFRIVLLTRLSPVFPFNLLNYSFGLTSVSFRDYLLASWIGMLPGTMMYVYLGSTTRQLADIVAGKVQQSPVQQVLFYAGLAATVVVTVIVTRIARKALEASIPEAKK